jgi:branched-chain amino acid transport system ATP-binding protein
VTGGSATEPRPGSPVLRLRNVTCDFGGLRAVAAVTFEIAPGERRAVIGPNGAGKTTLFRLISREERLTGGSVELMGRDITKESAHRVARMGLGRTYQITRIFSALTVEENVLLAAQGVRAGRFTLHRRVKARRALLEQAHDAIERTGLSRVTHAQAGELGHGQQRQLELALALAADPRVLLLDEPGAGLAASERHVMRELVSRLPDDMTVLLVEHDMELALGLADYVVCMHNGGTVAEGTPEDIKANEKVQDIYLGRSGA